MPQLNVFDTLLLFSLLLSQLQVPIALEWQMGGIDMNQKHGFLKEQSLKTTSHAVWRR